LPPARKCYQLGVITNPQTVLSLEIIIATLAKTTRSLAALRNLSRVLVAEFDTLGALRQNTYHRSVR
jgi:hypothetical protein